MIFFCFHYIFSDLQIALIGLQNVLSFGRDLCGERLFLSKREQERALNQKCSCFDLAFTIFAVSIARVLGHVQIKALTCRIFTF